MQLKRFHFSKAFLVLSFFLCIVFAFAQQPPKKDSKEPTAKPVPKTSRRPVIQPPATAGSALRIRPPESIPCSRNELTSFTGPVTYYKCGSGKVLIKMHTDENTFEKFEINYDGDDPSNLYLLRAEPFKQDDWKEIEVKKGVLRRGMRATVWVCNDGAKVVDWQPPER